MLLCTGTHKIQIVTTSTADIHVHASWMDNDAGAVTPGEDNTISVTATTTDVVPAPGGSITRNVKGLHIANAHASAPNDVTIQHVGDVTVQLEKVTLLAGERISYREGVGMRIINAQGLEKTVANSNPPILTKKSLADHPNSTTTATEVTDLSLACGVGTWIFEYFLRFQSATGTVGPKLSVNYDGTVTTFDTLLQVLTAAALDSSGVFDQAATAPQVMGGMAARAKDATGALIGTAGVDTTASSLP